MSQLIAIAAGGACGALSRYGLSLGLHRLLGTGFPWGTLAANLLGCLMLGAVWGWSLHSQTLTLLQQRAVSVGFLGALTTFSTFGLETVLLLEQRRPLAAAGNVGLNLALGLLAVWAGLALTRG